MDLFDPLHTRRPDPDLFFTRNDPHDPRLGQHARRHASDYDAAQVVIIGCPQDQGVRRNGGRLGAAAAPFEIRRYLYRLTVNEIGDLALFDIGDTLLHAELEETHALHEALVRRLLEDGKRVVVLGGGNDISYPDVRALAGAAGSAAAFNIDAHFDVRADALRNSGTPYRQLLEERTLQPRDFFELGWQPQVNSPEYAEYLRELGVRNRSLTAWRIDGLTATVQSCLRQTSAPAVFWGFDMDAVRASDAPGVSAPNPLGITGEELCTVAQMAGNEPRTQVVEFSEVNPAFDVDGRTARLAATAIWHYLAALVATA